MRSVARVKLPSVPGPGDLLNAVGGVRDGFSDALALAEVDDGQDVRVRQPRDRLDLAPFRLLPKPFDIAELVAEVRACIDAQAQ